MSRREKLKELLESTPDDVFLHYALAMECLSAGDIAEWVQKLEQTLQLDPTYVAAYFQLGQAWAGDEQTSRAREILAQGIEVAQRKNDAHAAAEMSAFLSTLS